MLGSNPGLVRLRHWKSDALTTRLDLIHTRLHTSHSDSATSHSHSARSHPHSAKSHPHAAKSHPHSAKSHPHAAKSHPHSARSHPQGISGLMQQDIVRNDTTDKKTSGGMFFVRAAKSVIETLRTYGTYIYCTITF
jgi:hypothetical protein